MSRAVLIVEDADICRATLEIAFTLAPELNIQCVSCAEEALRVLKTAEICALVTDLHLPGMDGFELIQLIRSHPVWARLPILVVSGDSDPETPARLNLLGADAYFPKPYSPSEVRRTLERLLNAV